MLVEEEEGCRTGGVTCMFTEREGRPHPATSFASVGEKSGAGTGNRTRVFSLEG